MKLIPQLLVAITVLLSFTMCNAQINNSVTEKVKVFGNCGMCKKTIEKAGSIKNTATTDWDAATQMATITYDRNKTNQDAILKRIAIAGYDSEKFLAPDDVYNNLHGCCQYERLAKVAVKAENKTIISTENHAIPENQTATISSISQNKNHLKSVFESYFLVKDALIAAQGTETAIAAKDFLIAINAVQMDKLDMALHMIWMKVVDTIKKNAELISDTKDVKQQRDQFIRLSKDMYSLIKVSKYETPVYYQFCPMANEGKGANWLSKENAVKNPYYGAMMLNCGKTLETIE